MFLANLLAVPLCAAFSTLNEPSVESVCRDYPERIQGLFGALDLERDGMQNVKTCVAAAQWADACNALLAYYQAAPTVPWLRKPAVPPGTDRLPGADAILNDEFTLYGVQAKAPRRADGGLDWSYNGPGGDKEWGWGLNRQYWASELFNAYRKTGNRAYVTAVDTLLRDWIASNPYPAAKSSTPQWRGLEAYIRVSNSWAPIFYGLQDVPELTPATRILMLSSIPDHAHYARHFHAAGGNWIAMELLGLETIAVCWPEFKESNAWFEYAFNRMLPEMTNQVYPDGVQKELTSHYHRVALQSFESFITLAERAGKPVPPEFRAGVERMNNYVAYSMRPSGYGPLNNDSNLDFTRPEVMAAAESFERPDWRYIATNGGEGNAPDGQPSVVFPWAGQFIMRNGWDADAHWAFFDIGPLGIGHWHYDKLHLSVSAFGRDILVDGGRYTYVGGPWRDYFVGSASHNVILIDGQGQRQYQAEATEPLKDCYAITPEYDYARGTYGDGYGELEGEVKHTRVVAYVRGQYWLVVDRITTDRPRTIQALWHFHPDCTVAADGASVSSTDEGKGNVRITPFTDLKWDVSLIRGQPEPNIQGWWSRVYNEKLPGACAVYSTPVEGSATFAWLITPARGSVPQLSAAGPLQSAETGVQLDMQFGTGPHQTISVPFATTQVECRAVSQ